jgi:Flp pilus assembly protein TadB
MGKNTGLSSAAGIFEPIITTLISVIKLILWAVNAIIIVILRLAKRVGDSIRGVLKILPRLLANRLPKKQSSWVGQQLIYAGVNMSAEELISIILVYSTVFGATAYTVSTIMSGSQFFSALAGIAAFGSVWALGFIIINMMITSRADMVETALPDVLSMVAQNISAGMTSYDALWSAARPEFGPLAVEIQEVAKASLTGIPLNDALMGMTNHVRSPKLLRIVRLIIQGMKSGGELNRVLQAISNDMRREQNLKAQMAAETNAQVVFIIFAIVIGAPLLFAISYEFIHIFSTMMDKLNVAELSKQTQAGMISMSPLAISPEFFLTYTVAMLAISAIFGSLLIGILRTGNVMGGFSAIPGLMTASLIIFFLAKYAMDMVFAGMITF